MVVFLEISKCLVFFRISWVLRSPGSHGGWGGHPQTASTSLSHVPEAALHLLLSPRQVKDAASLQGSLSTPRVLTSLPRVVAPTHFASPIHS